MKNQLEHQDILNFLFGGKSTFTFRNDNTNNRYTYKVTKSKRGEVYFVSLMTGTDNYNDFTFIGTIFNKQTFVHGKKSRISTDSIGYKAFVWCFNRLVTNRGLDTVTVWHEGFCGKCGRKLTVPESIQSGFGPECVKTRSLTESTLKCTKTVKNKNPQMQVAFN